MTARPSGRRQPCTTADARARLHDAEAFLDTAEAAKDPDVKATNAIHAAIESRDISAKDAATCIRQATTIVEAARVRSLSA